MGRKETIGDSERERPMSSLTPNTRLSHTPAQEESALRLPLSPSQRLSNISLHICAALAFALGRPDPRDARQCAPTGPTNTTNERHQHLRPNRDGRMNNRVECCTLPCAVLTSTPARRHLQPHGLRTIINAAPGTSDTNDDAPRGVSGFKERGLTHMTVIHLHNRLHPSRLPDSNKSPAVE